MILRDTRELQSDIETRVVIARQPPSGGQSRECRRLMSVASSLKRSATSQSSFIKG